MKTHPVKITVALTLLLTLCAQADTYTFGWPFVEPGSMTPRGGTSKGPEVTLDDHVSDAFLRIQEDGISDYERDRRAILAMVGPYRVSFDFMEVTGYQPSFTPAKPYRSWGTEHVYLLEDSGNFISLQHVLVMSVVDDKGNTHGPFVTKHWRQDWHYEPASVHQYQGLNSWEKNQIPKKNGLWAQTVWQVDDSPRYAGWGSWQHQADYSTWHSNETWRPLPRREYSVRDDYNVLIGSNHHTVVPDGWLQEEHNDKVVLEISGTAGKRLAREYGLARYQRIKGFDFSPGDKYMQATGAFWKLVRNHWNKLLQEREEIYLKGAMDQTGLFTHLYERAQAIADGESFEPQQNQKFIAETIDSFLLD